MTDYRALVAELVDAADSKSVVLTNVGVRVSPRAPFIQMDGITKE